MRLVDMHMHLGFAQDTRVFARHLEEDGVAAFSNTVTPGEYEMLEMSIGEDASLRLGLGLHPWWVESATLLNDMLAIFDSQLDNTLFIGEIGLDFYGKHEATRELQLEAFSHIASACSRKTGLLLSLHSVRAERELIDVLESSGCARSCTCVLHSYSGPSDQLKRAIGLGCLFSVGPRMLSTKKGREYARILPQEALLIETDLPEEADGDCDSCQIVNSLQETLSKLSLIRSCDKVELSNVILERSLYLLDL